jgi:hypothetical protein
MDYYLVDLTGIWFVFQNVILFIDILTVVEGDACTRRFLAKNSPSYCILSTMPMPDFLKIRSLKISML